MLFERTALSRKPMELAKQELLKLREEDILIPDLVFRDPYFLDFLGLKDTYSEKDLEMAIFRKLESFIIKKLARSLNSIAHGITQKITLLESLGQAIEISRKRKGGIDGPGSYVKGIGNGSSRSVVKLQI
jgi:hypothetical protein